MTKHTQKSAEGGCYGGLVKEPPVLKHFAFFFCINNLILGLF